MGDFLFELTRSWITFWPAVLTFLVAGIAGLKYGADWLVGGASNLGFRFGMSSVMIGLTLVAFGTSSPELVVSIMTAAKDQPEISLGNVIGSNIANTSLILGATALIIPLKIQKSSIRFDGPISFLAILLVLVLAWIGIGLSRWDGLLLLSIFTGWLLWLIRKSLREAAIRSPYRDALPLEGEVQFHDRSMLMDIFLMAAGLAGLVAGAELLVAGAVATARALSVPEVIVGLTVVAGGTSLPELAVCMVAAFKKQANITVGNVLGSNIFNALLILGTVTALAPMPFQIGENGLDSDRDTLFFDIPFCVLLCALIIPLMRHRRQLGRIKGLLLVMIYFAYITSLVLRFV